tara:strand:+ start:794 stop:1042 length:249 start_codon:yes stop_codon:yes gene_type:complete
MNSMNHQVQQKQLVVRLVSMVVRQYMPSEALEYLTIQLLHHFLLNMFVLLVVDQVEQKIMEVAVVLEDISQELLLARQVQLQ